MTASSLCNARICALVTIIIALAGWTLYESGPAAGASVDPPAPRENGFELQDAPPPVDGEELPGLRTATTRTWVKPGGMRVTRVYQQPVNFKDEQGSWKPIDDDLVPAADGWVNAANAYRVRIPSRLGAGPLRFERDGAWLDMQLRGADASGSVTGAAATFAGVAPGVTARWTAHPGAVKEDLVLAGAQASSSFAFDVSLSGGLRLVERPDGGVDAVGENGKVVFALAAPFAYDADGAISPERTVRMSADATANGWVVRLTVDDAWLQAPGRAYPVTVDPTVDMNPADDDCFLDGESTTTSFCGDSQIVAGHSIGTALHDHHGLLRFDVRSALPADANVLSAKLWAYALAKSGTSTSPLGAYRVTAPWTSAATWAKRNATDSWTTAGGDAASTAEDTASAAVVGQWSSWTLTDLVRSWLDGSNENDGVLLRDGGSSTENATRFASSDYASSSVWPDLEIEYFPRTGQLGDYTMDSQAIDDRAQLKVNVASGNLLIDSHDLHIAGRGLDLDVGRYFNSGDDWSRQMGFGSGLSVGKDIELLRCDSTGSMCFTGENGYHARFRKNADGTYAPAPAVNASLVRNGDGTWTMTFNRTGVRYTFFNNDDTFLTDVVDRNGNRIHFDYTSSRLSEIHDTQGRQIDVTRNVSGDITKIQDPTGRHWDYGYDGSRHLTSVTDPEGRVTTYRFDANDDVDRITDPRGNYIYITYDSAGRVASVTRTVDGTTTNDVTTRYAYSGPTGPCTGRDDVGRTIVTDARGHDTSYCWNAKGEVTSSRDALNRDSSKTYTPNGDAASYTSFVGTGNTATTTLTYDTDNNVTQRQQPAGERDSAAYWSAASNTRDPLRRYRPQSFTDPQGTDTFYGYDDNGNTTDVKDDSTSPRNQATLTYNSDGTLRSATDGEGHQTTFGYDVDGNLTSVTPPSVTSPGTLAATTYTYDSLSRVATVRDGRGGTLTLSYDGLDRVTSVSASDGSCFTNTYDANGNLTERDDSTGNRTAYTYDTLNRRTYEDFPGSSYNQYSYDKTSNLASRIDLSGTVSYGYDDINRVTSIVSPRPSSGTDTVSYSYNDPTGTDAFSLRTETLPGGSTVRMKRDLSGKLLDVLLRNSSSTTLAQRTYTYVDGGSVQRALVQSALDQAANRTSYAYANRTEDVGRLLQARTLDRSSALVAQRDYSYDKADNRTQKVVQTSGGTTTTTYAYNAANQLCWSYVGTSANGCASAPSGATSFRYDAAGEQTGGNHTGAWDIFGRLTSLDSSSLGYLSPTNGELTSYAGQSLDNDLFGLSRVVNGGTTTSIVRDPLSGLPVSQNDGTAKRWYVQDNIGTTVALTDSSGALARSYDPEPDGTSTTTGSGPAAILQFAGGHQLGSTGVYHFGARYYDTATGRWTSQDALQQYADLVQANRYAYAGGDPVNYADPSGFGISFKDALGAAGTALGTGVTAAGCATVETGVGAAVCLGGAASSSVGIGLSVDSLVN
ncbi:MAG: DNRLRE domain-containing protein [Conexibacter sp.]